MHQPIDLILRPGKETMLARSLRMLPFDLRHRQIAHQNRLKDKDHRQASGEPYGTRQGYMLQDRNTAERDENDAADIGHDRKKTRRQHEVSRCSASRELVA